MLKKTLITAALAAAVTAAGITATLAYADKGSRDEQVALGGAKLSLAEAVRRAETETQGRALEAELERKNSAYVYEVEVVGSDGVVTELTLDLASGQVLGRTQDDDEADERSKREGLGASKVDLVQAIAAAEQHLSGGKARSAELESDDGRLQFEVEVLKDGQTFEVAIDPVDGKVLSSEQDDDRA